MILVADSGSSKCTWALSADSNTAVQYFHTIGFNPFFISEEQMLSHLQNSNLNKVANQVKSLYFYGAGCSTNEMKTKINNTLQTFFQKATIVVEHDLKGACFATYRKEKNICCILGTGSNACLFDGNTIFEAAPSLGFILGDEASGNYFGKQLLNLYFNNKLPQDLKQKLDQTFEINIHSCLENIYHKERANRYLASFFPFIVQHKKDETLQNMIMDGLCRFFDLHICCYENYQNYEINFVGSVAYFLEDEIKKVAKEFNCKVGQIIKDPIENIIQYHQKKLAL